MTKAPEIAEPSAWHCPACEAAVVIDDPTPIFDELQDRLHYVEFMKTELEDDNARLLQEKADMYERAIKAELDLHNANVEIGRLGRQRDSLRQAISALYKLCAGHVDFRPDAKVMRDARNAYIRTAPPEAMDSPAHIHEDRQASCSLSSNHQTPQRE